MDNLKPLRGWMRGSVLLLFLLLAGCAQMPAPPARPAETAPVELIVFAAASLTNAFGEVGQAFQAAHPEITVIANYGGSSGLATQLMEGGVADLFASANKSQMQKVVDAGRIEETPRLFATNRLVVIVPGDNPAGIETLADLGKPGVKLLLAVPGVPVRDYADQMLQNLAADGSFGKAFADAVYVNLVSEEENVRQVTAKVALGEADAGIVYTSDVTPDIAAAVRQIEVPDTYNVIAAYPIARLSDAPHPEQAQAFIDFILSQEGQTILQKWGLGPAPQ